MASAPDSINFDCIAHRYDETRGGEERGKQFAPDLARLLKTDRPVVEVGVGTGVIAHALGELGFDVFGLDISEHMLAIARERLGDVVLRADAMHLPIATASLDQAFSVWVLHVVADVATVMSEVARVLVPGGRYLVMDGRMVEDESDPVRAAYRDVLAGLGMPARTSRVHEYARVAEARGLRVVEIVSTGPYPFESSPAETADDFEGRTHSWMWSVDEADWQRVVPPVIAQLRSLPDADRPVARSDYQEILVLEPT
jgi:ubiquinone/menaquinone biosynthesis C-methylase UbiE